MFCIASAKLFEILKGSLFHTKLVIEGSIDKHSLIEMAKYSPVRKLPHQMPIVSRRPFKVFE